MNWIFKTKEERAIIDLIHQRQTIVNGLCNGLFDEATADRMIKPIDDLIREIIKK